MNKKVFILGAKARRTLDYSTEGDTIKVEWYNTAKVFEALTILAKAAEMDDWELKQSKQVLQYHAKPIVKKMKQLAPKSSRQTYFTEQTRRVKGEDKIETRTHSAGELRRSIGVITKSRYYRKVPMIYVGVRVGKKYKSSGRHAWIAEAGRGPMKAKNNKYLYFANKDGTVVKKESVAGFTGRRFFKGAMESEGERARKAAAESFAYWFGDIWERVQRVKMKAS